MGPRHVVSRFPFWQELPAFGKRQVPLVRSGGGASSSGEVMNELSRMWIMTYSVRYSRHL